MRVRVHKYSMAPSVGQHVVEVKGAARRCSPLSVIVQNDFLSVYFEVDMDSDKITPIRFWVQPTGSADMPEADDYLWMFVDTIHLERYGLVYHLYFNALDCK